jgi:hypothetical protein
MDDFVVFLAALFVLSNLSIIWCAPVIPYTPNQTNIRNAKEYASFS